MSDHITLATGALVGLAAGDTLGVAVEGQPASRIREVYGQLRDLSQVRQARHAAAGGEHMPGSEGPAWMGLYSDDTQQALVLADSLIACGKADTDDFAQRLVRAAEAVTEGGFGVFRGVGPGFVESVQRLQSGVDPRMSGVDSAGNGAAMRIAPAGIMYWSASDDELTDAVIAVSRVTHRDVRGLAAGVSVAAGIARLLRTPAMARKKVLEEVVGCTRRAEQRIADGEYGDFCCDDTTVHAYSEGLAHLADMLDMWEGTARKRIAAYANTTGPGMEVRAGSAYALCSVVSAWWYFLVYAESVEEAIVAAVNGGGDTDTIAAITGALAGARNGSDAVPAQWLARLANREQIIARARALAGDTEATGALRDFVEMEQALAG